jgi:hypothetical protein
MGIDLDALISIPGALTAGRHFDRVLAEALNLISDESRWTQGSMARDNNGYPVKPRDPRAASWNILGAVAYCSNSFGLIDPSLIRYLDDFLDWKYPRDPTTIEDQPGRYNGVCDFNDYHSHHSVVALLHEAWVHMMRYYSNR